MRSLLRINDLTKENIFEIYKIANDIQSGNYSDYLKGKTTVMFFPNSSIRTRVTFEKGIYLLGGQTILFPQETLDKKEEIKDVVGYLNNWADVLVIRYKDISLLDEINSFSDVPVINAMTDINHPCEILTDLYSLSKIHPNYLNESFLFCGKRGNIGLAWKEASEVLGFRLSQCCPDGYEIDGINIYKNLDEAIIGKDIICTDSLSKNDLDSFESFMVTKSIMDKANSNAILNPCPPFYRGEEVSEDVIDSKYFVGYEFKKYLLQIQQAIIIYCLEK